MKTLKKLLVVLCLGSPVILPLLAVVYTALHGNFDNIFLASLPIALLTSLALMIGTALLSCAIGFTAAWYVTVIKLPGKALLDLLLILPLALPAYIVSFAYTETYDNINFALWQASAEAGLLPPVAFGFRNIFGAIWVFSVTLYPYVYIFTRAAMLSRLGTLLDVSRLYAVTSFTRLLLIFPLVRRGVLVGLALVMMEVLTDYGLAEYYGLNTLAKTMFDIWFGLHDPHAAAQIASCMIIVAVLLLSLEQFSRAAQAETIKHAQPYPFQTDRFSGFFYSLMLCLPFIFGFVGPLAFYVYYGVDELTVNRMSELGETALQTILIAALVTFLTLAIGGTLHLSLRRLPRILRQGLFALCSCGYAMPGMVFALGTLVSLSTVDMFFIHIFGSQKNWLPLLTGSLAMLVFAAVGRFMAIGLAAYDHAEQAIPKTLRYTARLMPSGQGWRGIGLFWPMRKPALQAAAILILVDYIKDLPITLILRPFGVETLAVAAFMHAQNEQVAKAAPEAITIALLSALAILTLCLRVGYRDPFGALPAEGHYGASSRQPRIQTS